MDSVKTSKRFSFAGFSSGLSRSLSFSNIKPTVKIEAIPIVSATATTPQQKKEQEETAAEELRKSKRAQKSKSLYIKSFTRKSPSPETATVSKYDASEAKQSNSKEIRSSIRRSLSAVLYASPHSTDDDDAKSYSNKLVPVLVTPGLSESVGGILIDDGTKNKIKDNQTKVELEKKKKKSKKPVEYDNSLEVIAKDDTTTIIWQGYGYTIKKDEQEEVVSEMILSGKEDEENLEERFEKEIWTSYCGLIHPLHLFKDISADKSEEIVNRGRWAGLSVTELRRYYDNYGSMMVKIREARMLEQQTKYQRLSNDDVKKEWIIPDITPKQDLVAGEA
jgi:hypothetical protein